MLELPKGLHLAWQEKPELRIGNSGTDSITNRAINRVTQYSIVVTGFIKIKGWLYVVYDYKENKWKLSPTHYAVAGSRVVHVIYWRDKGVTITNEITDYLTPVLAIYYNGVRYAT